MKRNEAFGGLLILVIIESMILSPSDFVVFASNVAACMAGVCIAYIINPQK